MLPRDMTMHEETFKQWEEAARTASAEVCAAINGMDFSLPEFQSVAPIDANGTNSLDEKFVNRLANREHLSDGFLEHA